MTDAPKVPRWASRGSVDHDTWQEWDDVTLIPLAGWVGKADAMTRRIGDPALREKETSMVKRFLLLVCRQIHYLTRDFVKNGLLASGLIPGKVRVIAIRLMGAEIGRAWIGPMCFIGSGPLTMGDGSFVSYQVFLDTTAGIHIGRNSRIGPRTTIITGSHLIGETESTRTARTPETRLHLRVKIGDNVWVGTGVIILPGVTVGNGVVIGAGAVVRADCEPNTLYAGVPARAIRKLPV